jgi:hypothetical protein
VIAYGCLADAMDDYVHIREDTVLEAWIRFTKSVIDVFREEYLRATNE